jgi:endo-1,4-beta-xylanase
MWPKKPITVGVVTALAATTAFTLVTSADAAPPASTSNRVTAPGVPVQGHAKAARVGVRADPSLKTLRQLGDRAHLKMGVAVGMGPLNEDPTYRHLAATQFSSVTPENVMKWEVVEPQQGTYDYAQAEELVQFAKKNHQIVRGHTLVWHSQLPAWVTSGNFTTAQFRQIMRRHIRTEMTRFKGDITEWDVVNEAFNEDGTLRNSIWLQKLGPGYIEEAFRYAHKIDPKAKLFYNDYNIEGVNAKSNAVYQMFRQMKADGVPVQGVGLQSHFDIQYNYPPDILANMQRFADLKVRVSVTEADVRMDLPVDPTKAQAQAGAYDALLSSCLLVTRCHNFTVWGISDRYSWIPGVFKGQGGALLWDDSYQTKPAYDSIRRILAIAGNDRG